MGEDQKDNGAEANVSRETMAEARAVTDAMEAGGCPKCGRNDGGHARGCRELGFDIAVARGGPLETAEDIGKRLLDRFEESRCVECEQPFTRRRGSERDACSECTERAERSHKVELERVEVFARFDDTAARWLQAAGLTKRELGAERERIPPALWAMLAGNAMPGPIAKEMMRGRCPQVGFGLTGTAGGGKTFALAWLVRAMLESRWQSWIPKVGKEAIRRQWLTWLSWPETVNRMRIESLRDEGLEAVDAAIKGMAAAEVLVLDDLGVERLRGGYAEDWVASQLDLLVDTRHNEMKPTWYTTNLTGAELADRYGSRLCSRLCGENGLYVVADGPDLRMGSR